MKKKLQDRHTDTEKSSIEMIEKRTKTLEHYDNTNDSLYQFAERQKLNAYEFDLVKRIVRCRKKGEFLKDLQKTKALIDLYIKES